jgi:membrane associated rhomboid family serine protease
MVEREYVELALISESHVVHLCRGSVELASCESNPGRSLAEWAYASPFDGFTLDRVSTGGPDLFVVCKNCGSEVSPYITECPYCGTRLRKRAPKIDRDGRIAERVSRRPTATSLPRLRRGEIPGIRPERHPYATLVLVALGIVGCLIWRTSVISIFNLVVAGNYPGNQWWRFLTAPFVYDNTGYAVVALAIIAIYGTLLERRHGPVVVIVLAFVGGAGGIALASQIGNDLLAGGNGAALALLTAWAVPDLMRLLRKHDFDGDLIGTGVLAAVIALMHLAATDASWVAAGVGVAAGLLLGSLLMRLRPG